MSKPGGVLVRARRYLASRRLPHVVARPMGGGRLARERQAHPRWLRTHAATLALIGIIATALTGGLVPVALELGAPGATPPLSVRSWPGLNESFPQTPIDPAAAASGTPAPATAPSPLSITSSAPAACESTPSASSAAPAQPPPSGSVGPTAEPVFGKPVTEAHFTGLIEVPGLGSSSSGSASGSGTPGPPAVGAPPITVPVLTPGTTTTTTTTTTPSGTSTGAQHGTPEPAAAPASHSSASSSASTKAPAASPNPATAVDVPAIPAIDLGCGLIGDGNVGGVATGESSVHAHAVSYALALLGTPYLWGGESKKGFDCSGLVQYVYRQAGLSLPRVAQDQYDAGPVVPVGGTVVPGDLVFFGKSTSAITHVGMFVGDGIMVDAPHTGAFVRLDRIDSLGDLVGVTSPGGQ